MNATMNEPTIETVTGVVLAGGRGQRMGGADKGLIEVAGQALAARVLDALAAQTAQQLISANRNLSRYRALGPPVLSDSLQGYQGPLAGIASAMRRAATPWLLVSPCDTPLIPVDLRERLAGGLRAADAQLAVCEDAEHLHPLHALLPVGLADDLAEYLAADGRSVRGWIARHRVATVSVPAQCFVNANTDADLARLARLLGGTP
ncbi:MAG: molybdenum cofactor guanylyltransferase [Thiohalocapsa sp.]|nr:molybdenum cofactor guanylyltransferase [Thiohalocapsa sp.]MCF7992513.1 molybdenum cofactor guanylyltransferase [Thiohalocapsa sp.]